MRTWHLDVAAQRGSALRTSACWDRLADAARNRRRRGAVQAAVALRCRFAGGC